MTHAADLIATYNTIQWIIIRQAEGLSHEDSVRQPQPRGNCFNWVLGHVLNGRNRALMALGHEPFRAGEVKRWYATGSDPIQNTDQGLSLADLLAALEETHERISAALGTSSAADLEAIYEAENDVTVGARLAGLQWHETYHVGQLELLRQLAGTDDKII